MACPPQDITETELAILRLLWERGPLTARVLADSLYRRRTPAEHATVQSLLQRLEEKSLVRRDRSERAHLFAAVVSRDEVIRRRLRTLADKLCDGSLSPLLSHLVRAEELTAKERQELRELFNQLERRSSATRPRSTKPGKRRR